MSIKSYFNQRSEARAAQKAYFTRIDVLTEAVAGQNLPLVKALLDEVKGSPLYGPQQSRLLAAALRTDNVEIFNTVFGTVNDPNFHFSRVSAMAASSSVMARTPILSDNEHILYSAIRAGREKIALSLAQNQKVDVSESGYSSMVYFGGSSRTPYAVTPLAAAREKGMTKVADAIAARQAPRPAAAPKAPGL